jgi:lipid II:glycine glycyltransferase (peptidoglycan interpeptide bridge formation enzyme)
MHLLKSVKIKIMRSLLQTKEWALFKKKFGWGFKEVKGVFVLKRRLPFQKEILYSPEVWLEPQTASEVVKALVDYARSEKNAIFYTLEILNPHDECPLNPREYGFEPSFEDYQPRWRQIIPLTPSKEEIFAQMKPLGRRNIRIAEKKGVITRIHDDLMFLEEDTKIFYELMQETAKRHHFAPRKMDYFRELLRLLYENKYGFLVTASFNDKPLASLIISVYDRVASFLYGASTEIEKERMANYAAQYAAILEAKKRGAKVYDLLAISPPGWPKAPLAIKYAGITRFKENFGGYKEAISGAFDLILKPNLYKIYRYLEILRRGQVS